MIWNIKANEFSNFAQGKSAGGNVEVSMDGPDADGDLHVAIDEGSGYMGQSCSTFVPMTVLLALMRNRGYTVIEPGASDPETVQVPC